MLCTYVQTIVEYVHVRVRGKPKDTGRKIQNISLAQYLDCPLHSGHAMHHEQLAIESGRHSSLAPCAQWRTGAKAL